MIPQHRAYDLPPAEQYGSLWAFDPDGRYCLEYDTHTHAMRRIELETGAVELLPAIGDDFTHTDAHLHSISWFAPSHLLLLYEEYVPPGQGQTTTVLRSVSLDTNETTGWCRVSCPAAMIATTSSGQIAAVEEGQLKRFDAALQLIDATPLPVASPPEAMAAREQTLGLLFEDTIALYDAEQASWTESWARCVSPHAHDTQEYPGDATIALGPGSCCAVGRYGQYLQYWSEGRCVADVPLFLRDGHGQSLSVAWDGSYALWGHLVFALPDLRRGSLHSGSALLSSGLLHPQQHLLITGDRNALHLWDVEGLLLQPLPPGPQERASVMCTSHNERWLVVGTDRRLAFLYDLDEQSLHLALEVSTYSVNSLAFHPNGRHLLVPQVEGEVGVWDLRDGHLVSIWRGLPFAHPRRTAWSEDRQTLMIQGHESVALIDAETQAVTSAIGPFLDESRDYGYGPSALSLDDADLHPSGRWVSVCLGYERNEAVIVDVETGEEVETFADGQLARFGADGNSLLVCDGRETKGFSWPLASRDVWMRQQRCSDIVMVSTDKGHGAILCDNNDLCLVSLARQADSSPESSLEGWDMRFYDSILAAAAAPSRGLLFTGGHALWIGRRDLWDEGALEGVFPAGAGHKIESLAFDPTGQYLIAGEMEGRLHVWEVATCSRVGFLDTTSRQGEDSPMEINSLGQVEWLRFLPGTDALLAIGSEWFRWDDWQSLSTEAPASIWEEPPYDIMRLSSCGRWLLSGSSYGEALELWDTETQTLLHSFATGLERMDLSALSDDGTLVLCGGREGQNTILQAWSGETGALLHTLRVDAGVRGCVLTPDGDALLWMQTSTTRIEAAEKGAPIADVSGYDEEEMARRRGLVVRWKVHEGQLMRAFDMSMHPNLCDADGLTCAADVPHVLLLEADHSDGMPAVIDASRDGAVQPLFHKSANGMTADAISRDGELIATADWSGDIRLWSRRTGQCIGVMCCTTDGGWWNRRPDAEDTIHLGANS